MNKKLPAFTLLEIIVTMVIFASILALGLVSFANYSKSTTVNEASGDAIAILKETQSMAKNNTVPKDVTSDMKLNSVFYYMLEFTNTGTSPVKGVINRYIFARNVTTNAFSLPLDTETEIQSKLIGTVNYANTTSHVIQDTCVLFEALTGKIIVMQRPSIKCSNNVTLVYTSLIEGEYNIELKLPGENTNKVIYINTSENNFGAKGES